MSLRSALPAIAAAIAVWSPTASVAASDRFRAYGDAAPGHPGLTYFDLIKQVVPDLAENDDGQAEARLPKPPRHIAGANFEGPPPDPVTVGFVEDRRILVGGKRRIALLVEK